MYDPAANFYANGMYNELSQLLISLQDGIVSPVDGCKTPDQKVTVGT